MKLVVGLGNPGNEYNFTRHNVGFLSLDFYFKLKGLHWKPKPFLGAITGRMSGVLFIKPQEYYNNTGEVVQRIASYYKIDIRDILAICDNFDLEFGKVRQRVSGASGGNNGLKSLTRCLGTSEFPRIRVGTSNKELRQQLGDIDFVLSKFTPDEKSQLPEILNDICKKIDDFIG